MTNSQEKRINRAAQTKGYRLEKVGKGPHHGRFCIVNVPRVHELPPASLAPSFPSRSRKLKTG